MGGPGCPVSFPGWQPDGTVAQNAAAAVFVANGPTATTAVGRVKPSPG